VTIPVAGWVSPFGHPRIKACSRLPVAFRSVPRPSSPPGAKASTECPSRARDLRARPEGQTRPAMHRNHPHGTARVRTAGHSAHRIASERICRVAGWRFLRSFIRSDFATTARPETHQNLIHPDKRTTTRSEERADARHHPASFNRPNAIGSISLRDVPGPHQPRSRHPAKRIPTRISTSAAWAHWWR
jgi:hypothetical protein